MEAPTKPGSLRSMGILSWLFGGKPAKRSYDAAKQNNATWGGRRISASANADHDLSAARPEIRARSRNAYQNNASARAIVESLVGLVVSSGIDIEPDTGNDADDAAIKAAWTEWLPYADAAGCLDLWELQRQAYRSIVVAGEFLWVLADIDDPRRPIPFAIHSLEPDQLSDAPVADIPRGSRFIDGIELDRYGRPVAYHILSEPADSIAAAFGGSLVAGSGGAAIRVPAGAGRATGYRVEADRVIHGFEKGRPSQTRGEPNLAPVLTTLWQEKQLVDAELTAAKVAAAHAVAVTVEGGAAAYPGPDAGLSNDGQGPTYDFSPGSVNVLSPGESVEVIGSTRPSQAIAPFRDMLRGDLAGAMRLPKRLIDRDVTKANYSSMRADMLDTRRQLDPVQQWFGRLVAGEVYRRALPQLALQAGVSLAPIGTDERRQQERFTLHPDGWAYVDPQKDIAASIDGIRAGLTTWQDEIQSKGKDPRTVLAQLKAELGDEVLLAIFDQSKIKPAPVPEPAEQEDEGEDETEDEEARSAEMHRRQCELEHARAPVVQVLPSSASIVNQIQPSEVRLEPQINVAPSTATIENQITVQPSTAEVRVDVQPAPAGQPVVMVENIVEAPIVNVSAPAVTVENEVVVEQRPIRAEPQRDGSVIMRPIQGD
jgi:lambda family phage portal protein